MAAPPKHALAKWEKVRSFALGLPGAGEEFPWGETVVKVNKKIFVFLGVDDGSYPLGVGVKLKGEEMHAHALSCPGAEPSGYGLGKAGWVQIPLAQKGAPSAEVLCDWVEESYRTIATKKLIAELEAR
ncbi:MmcQ/YjbR family DNA-binding protein [Streptomyces lunaelactis]|uniref:MmcQ/YjbR family DNA-binding protein n=1 Tax=Streptomyces lunaelactis TaxID=1535768 RepID=UPI00158486DF|nr:MmcQ/YjbR family DNA-binding protein [Streptomyces lunaelactis]NUK00418.1 MmcQ/YjbR family DNA-binding protein [Streptomyces lunaelactis]NUK13794.1 MmcQ/YjbR family DNA-binding protein [Streptomyces lunaelactis]NUK78008.1 MmcQ/YjbR family DNA-binding protein [Streptomyces lunaelactis]